MCQYFQARCLRHLRSGEMIDEKLNQCDCLFFDPIGADAFLLQLLFSYLLSLFCICGERYFVLLKFPHVSNNHSSSVRRAFDVASEYSRKKCW